MKTEIWVVTHKKYKENIEKVQTLYHIQEIIYHIKILSIVN